MTRGHVETEMPSAAATITAAAAATTTQPQERNGRTSFDVVKLLETFNTGERFS